MFIKLFIVAFCRTSILTLTLISLRKHTHIHRHGSHMYLNIHARMERLFVFFQFYCLSHSHATWLIHTLLHLIKRSQPIHIHTQTHSRVYLAKIMKYTPIVVNRWAEKNRTFACWLPIELGFVVVLFSHLKRNDSMEFARWHAPFTYIHRAEFLSTLPSQLDLPISAIPISDFGQCKEREREREGKNQMRFCVWVFVVAIVGDLCRFSWVVFSILFGVCVLFVWMFHFGWSPSLIKKWIFTGSDAENRLLLPFF